MTSSATLSPTEAWWLGQPLPVTHVDWSHWYLLDDEEDMGESGEHFQIVQMVLSILGPMVRHRGLQVASNQYIAWLEHHPLVRVSPDVYVVRNPWPILPESWQTWRDDHPPPMLAIEIVSPQTWTKDYRDNPPKYDQLGIEELLIFDPAIHTQRDRTDHRAPLHLWRRQFNGNLECVAVDDQSAFLATLNAYAQVVDGWLRFSTDAEGQHLYPTTEEEAEAAKVTAAEERARAESERARAESEHARAESERARAECEHARAESERARADRLEALLRAANVDHERDG